MLFLTSEFLHKNSENWISVSFVKLSGLSIVFTMRFLIMKLKQFTCRKSFVVWNSASRTHWDSPDIHEGKTSPIRRSFSEGLASLGVMGTRLLVPLKPFKHHRALWYRGVQGMPPWCRETPVYDIFCIPAAALLLAYIIARGVYPTHTRSGV